MQNVKITKIKHISMSKKCIDEKIKIWYTIQGVRSHYGRTMLKRRKKMKKTIKVLLLAALCIVLLTACQFVPYNPNEETTTTGCEDDVVDTTPVTLVKRFKLDYQDAAGNWQELGEFSNPGQRLCKLPLDIECVALKLTILETFGNETVKVFSWTVK